MIGKDSEEYFDLYRKKLQELKNRTIELDRYKINISDTEQEIYKLKHTLATMQTNIMKIIETNQDITEIKLKTDYDTLDRFIHTHSKNIINMSISNPIIPLDVIKVK